jgi:hypothetical protein
MTKKDKTSRSGPKGFWIPITNTRAMDALKTMAALEYRTINEQAAMLVLQTLIDRGFLKGPVDVQGQPILNAQGVPLVEEQEEAPEAEPLDD